MLAPVSKITDLSFVRSTKEMWVPERTGDYADDCALGRIYARELMGYIRQTESPHAFGHVARAITEGGRFEGVEIGFCSEIGIVICNGAVTQHSVTRVLAAEPA